MGHPLESRLTRLAGRRKRVNLSLGGPMIRQRKGFLPTLLVALAIQLALALAEMRSPQLEAIEQEAAQLWQRSQRASPAEQAQIEQRAGQLLQQLQQLGR